MSFVGVIDRVENENAYIIVEEGMFEITVPVHILKDNKYRVGDTIAINIHDNDLNLDRNIS